MLGLLSTIYGYFVRRRNARFDAHSVPIVQVDMPVISVGNITTGGTGKTPLVQWIVRYLQEHGSRPAVILRGYKRTSRGLLVVHDGEKLLTDVHKAGDEAFLHATTLNVPVVVCASKVDAAVYAAGFLPCDVIVVDDGFQHRSLHRDIDVVLADETPAAKLQLLPKGILREPVENIRRADVVVRINVRSVGVYPLGEPENTVSTLNELKESASFSTRTPSAKCLLPVTGIAHPQRFIETIKSMSSGKLPFNVANVKVCEPMTFADHKRYTTADVKAMIGKAQACDADIMTTEKDAVKLQEYASQFCSANVNVFVVAIRTDVLEGGDILQALILEKVINNNRKSDL